MPIPLFTGDTHGSESRISDPQLHAGVHAINHDHHPNSNRNYRTRIVREQLFQMDWRKYNPKQSLRRFCYNLLGHHSWRSLYTRDHRKSSGCGNRDNRHRSQHNHKRYHYLLIGLLSIGSPALANEPEVQNTSNPVAAATGNVTNQAVQFQNNGAPSRQHYGPNISCNGSTMTFSPFYMGNNTQPYDPEAYVENENYGFQVNFMIPLDKSGLKQCRRIAARQEEKMRLDYELVRALKCAELQQKGFMIHPKSPFYSMCSDIIPIAKYIKSTQPPTKEGFKFPWQKKK